MTISNAEARVLLSKPKRKNKFNAKRVTVDGRTYDSHAEARYGEELYLRERLGEVSAVERQRKFDLIVNGEKIGHYKADFAFFDHIEDRFRVVDVKGVVTREFKRTRKLIKALYQIDVEVVR